MFQNIIYIRTGNVYFDEACIHSPHFKPVNYSLLIDVFSLINMTIDIQAFISAIRQQKQILVFRSGLCVSPKQSIKLKSRT